MYISKLANVYLLPHTYAGIDLVLGSDSQQWYDKDTPSKKLQGDFYFAKLTPQHIAISLYTRGGIISGEPIVTWYPNGTVRVFAVPPVYLTEAMRTYLKVHFNLRVTLNLSGNDSWTLRLARSVYTVPPRGYAEFDINELEMGYTQEDRERQDRFEKTVSRLRYKVLEPLNQVMWKRRFAFPLPQEQFGRNKLCLKGDDATYFLFFGEGFRGGVLDYTVNVTLPVDLEDQIKWREDGHFPVKHPKNMVFVPKYKGVPGLLVDCINSFAVFKVLSRYFGKQVLLSTDDVFKTDRVVFFAGGGVLQVSFLIHKKIFFPITSRLLKGDYDVT